MRVFGTGRGPKRAKSTEKDVAETTVTLASSPVHARLSFGTGRRVQTSLNSSVPKCSMSTENGVEGAT